MGASTQASVICTYAIGGVRSHRTFSAIPDSCINIVSLPVYIILRTTVSSNPIVTRLAENVSINALVRTNLSADCVGHDLNCLFFLRATLSLEKNAFILVPLRKCLVLFSLMKNEKKYDF